MPTTRRTLLTTSAALGAALAAPAVVRAATGFVYKYGVDLPADHPTAVWMQTAADRIKAETGGQLEIRIFPNSQLGSSTDMMSQLRSGALEFMGQSGPVLSLLVPAAALNSVGFAFTREEDVWPAMDGALGAYIRAQIEKSSLVVMDAIWGHGFRQMTTSTGPIAAPADLRGLKVRVPAGPIFISLFKALGAAPTTINFNELYSALQTRVVDGQENPLALLISAKLYEVQTYVSLTNHMWAGYWFLANRRTFEALPPEIRATVSRVVDDCARQQRAELARQDGQYRQDLAAKGCRINAVEAAGFRAALSASGYYKEWQGRLGDPAWTLLEKYAGPLA